jgi:hypothetical protein
MSKEEIREYLDRVERLELTLLDEDKKTLQWLIYGYNQCAKLLNETEQENIQLKTQLLEKKCSDKDIEYKEKNKLQQRIDKAIEFINNSDWLKEENFYDFKDLEQTQELLEILKGNNND